MTDPGDSRVWVLYIVECANGALYTGVTLRGKAQARVTRHNNGKGAKYTAAHRPVSLVFTFDADLAWHEALSLEVKVKRLRKAGKEEFIRGEGALADSFGEAFRPVTRKVYGERGEHSG